MSYAWLSLPTSLFLLRAIVGNRDNAQNYSGAGFFSADGQAGSNPKVRVADNSDSGADNYPVP